MNNIFSSDQENGEKRSLARVRCAVALWSRELTQAAGTAWPGHCIHDQFMPHIPTRIHSVNKYALHFEVAGHAMLAN